MRPHLFLLCLTLAGCSTYSEQFDCPYGQGLGCTSLSKVNKLLDEQRLDVSDEPTSSGNTKRQVHIYYGPDQMSKLITISDAVDL